MPEDQKNSWWERFINIRKGYFWTSLWLVIALASGLLVIAQGQEVLDSSSALLWSLVYVAMGGLGGLIFGIPKSVSPDDLPSGTHKGESGDAVKSDSDSSPVSTARKRAIQENTNLYQISDWLTKTVVGAGLVQVKEIPGFVWKVATKMGQGMLQKGHPLDAAISISAAIILYFILYGFIAGYLVTRIMITDVLEGEDSN